MLSLFSQFIFGNSSSSGKPTSASGSGSNLKWPSTSSAGSSSWKDRSLCFDLRKQDLEVNHGEQLIACFYPIEDIKGNQDEFGLLRITNLRIIWQLCWKKRQASLSIGWRTVVLVFEQNMKNAMGSATTNLCVLTKYESTKYEFVFRKMFNNCTHLYFETDEFLRTSSDGYGEALTELKRLVTSKFLNLSHLTPMYMLDPFEVVFKVWRAYKQTSLFRHCRANLGNCLLALNRESLAIENGAPSEVSGTATVGEMNTLPGEFILDVYTGIIQVESRSNQHLGSLTLTNVRLVWVDKLLALRNLSIPFTRVESVKLKQSDRILINTLDYLATANQIEFRAQKVDTQPYLVSSSRQNSETNQVARTKLIFEQIQRLHALYRAEPKFGPESCEDCLNYMSHLVPVWDYFESLDSKTMLQKPVENFGPQAQDRMYLVDFDSSDQIGATRGASDEEEDTLERSESDLNYYSARLNNYLDEQPIDRDSELVYSSARFLVLSGGKLSKMERQEHTYASDSREDERQTNDEKGFQSSYPQRCFYEVVTFATYSIVLITSLSLITAGVFKEQVNYEEPEQGKLQLSLNFSAFLGFVLFFYSIIGSCMNCLNKLEGKYLLVWSLNVVLSFLGLLRASIRADVRVETGDFVTSEELRTAC